MHMISIPLPFFIGFCIAFVSLDCYNFRHFVVFGLESGDAAISAIETLAMLNDNV